MSYDNYERGREWRDKGFFWFLVATLAAVPNLLLWLVGKAVADPGWSIALVLVQIAILAFQVAAGVRMSVCNRRARKIWRGAR